MTFRSAPRWLPLLAMFAAADARAGPVLLSGGLGGGFEHRDLASSTQASGVPGWNWAGSLTLGWAPLAPEILSLSGGADYGANRWVNAPTTRSDRWTYRGSASALSTFPLSLNLDVGREWSASSGLFGTVGETLVTSEILSTRLAVRGYPQVHASFARSDVESEVLGGENRRSGSRRLSVGSTYSTPAVSYSVDYGGSWADSGAVAEGNYRFHGVNVAASAKLSDSSDLRYNHSYTLRQPTVRASRNPRLDQSIIGTGVGVRPGPQTRLGLDYTYNHALVEAPGFEVESLGHGASLSGTHRWSESWTSDSALQFTHAEVRNAEATRSSDAQSLSAGASWTVHPAERIRTTLSARGNGGAVQSSGDLAASYGGSGGGTASYDVGLGTASLSYGGSYQVNDATLDGREWSHRVSLDGRVSRGERRASLSLQGSTSKRTDELVGTRSSHSATASAQAGSGRTSAILSGGVTYGITARYGYDILPGLYVLPYELEALTRHASLSVNGSIRRIRWSLRLSTARVELVDEPREYQHEAEATMSYRLGAFQLHASDRFVAGGRGAVWHRGNMVMVRLTRAFALAF